LYSPGCPHLGQVSVCVRISVVSLKNSRSSIASSTPPRPSTSVAGRPGSSSPAQSIPYSSLP
jgi:hypothetical protein